MADSYPEDITSEAEEETAGQTIEETVEEKLMAEPRKKSKMTEPKLRKSRFPETFTGTG
jgi:hypothetical protein